jgi:hypothetical protein
MVSGFSLPDIFILGDLTGISFILSHGLWSVMNLSLVRVDRVWSSGSSIRYEIGALQVAVADRSVRPVTMEDFLPCLKLRLLLYELSSLPNFMDQPVVSRPTMILVPIFR